MGMYFVVLYLVVLKRSFLLERHHQVAQNQPTQLTRLEKLDRVLPRRYQCFIWAALPYQDLVQVGVGGEHPIGCGFQIRKDTESVTYFFVTLR